MSKDLAMGATSTEFGAPDYTAQSDSQGENSLFINHKFPYNCIMSNCMGGPLSVDIISSL